MRSFFACWVLCDFLSVRPVFRGRKRGESNAVCVLSPCHGITRFFLRFCMTYFYMLRCAALRDGSVFPRAWKRAYGFLT